MHQNDDEQVQRAAELKGVGTITASAMVATVSDFKKFRNAAQFGAWLGLAPKQNSSGGKTSLGSITKLGSNYLRTLLIQGAKAAVLTGNHNDDAISQWAHRLRERCGGQRCVVALANKNVRIFWTVMTKDKHYDAHHVSVPPAGAIPAAA